MRQASLLLFAMVACGCGDPVVSERDNREVREEFSQDNYEREMRRLGRTKELDDEKARSEERERQEQAAIAPPTGPSTLTSPKSPEPNADSGKEQPASQTSNQNG